MNLTLQRWRLVLPVVVVVLLAASQLFGQGRGGQQGGGQAPPATRAAAPIDLTGYWASLIVDEWRFRVTPQKGDIAYLPLNQRARDVANAWDPDKDVAEGRQCRAYGAVGLMQRAGRFHVLWKDDNTLQIEADSGTQTRLLHFGAAPAELGQPSWQGYSVAGWQMAGGGRRGAAAGQTRTGTLRIVTTNMLAGYIRKNGVPYSANALLTEYFNILDGTDGEPYLVVTASVEDPTYLTGPFLRTYTFKKQ